MSRHTFPLTWLAVLLLVPVAAIACGDSEPVDFGDELPDGAPRIDQDNLTFKPSSLTVQTGEAVYFTNSETARHTVTIEGENESGDMRRGDVFSFTFATPGEYKITCDYHPQMRATITVE